jgi:hypothetical protein
MGELFLLLADDWDERVLRVHALFWESRRDSSKDSSSYSYSRVYSSPRSTCLSVVSLSIAAFGARAYQCTTFRLSSRRRNDGVRIECLSPLESSR